jgi:hypothetical protein
MPNLSGLSPLTIKLTGSILDMVTPLKPNTAHLGMVHVTPKGAHVQVAGLKIPLPANSTLPSGQAVTVTHESSVAGAKVVITPTPIQMPTASAPPTLASSVPVLNTLVETLPLLQSVGPQQASQLVPMQLPQTESVLRMALQIFEFKGKMQAAVATLKDVAQLVQKAGVDLPALKQVLSVLGAEVDLDDAQSVVRFLKTLQAHTRGGAIQVSSEGSLEDTLFVLLGKLRNDPTLLQLLESKGAVTSFQQAVDTLMEQVAGQHVQNSRSSEVPYAYLNIPFPEGSGIQEAQIHVLGDGHGENEWDEEGHGQIVFDLQTTGLGELWIHLSHRPEQCVCRFEVESEAIVEAINGAADELQGRLEAQGFERVHVEASLRSTDRMEALAGVLQRFSGLDVQI